MPLAERGGLEVTPIVVKGVMYLPGTGKVYALDAATGKEIWHYDVASPSAKGVAYWPGDKNNAPRVVFTTFARKVVELDAATGKPVPTFGKDGEIELTVGYSGVPTIYKNLAFLGASVGELPERPSGRHARHRRSYRRPGLDLPQRGPAGRSGTRHVARRRMERPLRHQRLGLVHDRRSEEESSLHADRRPFAELLRRRSPRRRIFSAIPLSRSMPPLAS